jgi:hypothetical protein
VAGTAHLGDLALGELVMPASATRGDTAGAGSIMVCCPALAQRRSCVTASNSPKIGGLKKTPPFFQNKSCKTKVERFIQLSTRICLGLCVGVGETVWVMLVVIISSA